jgi:hypothetical protein
MNTWPSVNSFQVQRLKTPQSPRPAPLEEAGQLLALLVPGNVPGDVAGRRTILGHHRQRHPAEARADPFPEGIGLVVGPARAAGQADQPGVAARLRLESPDGGEAVFRQAAAGSVVAPGEFGPQLEGDFGETRDVAHGDLVGRGGGAVRLQCILASDAPLHFVHEEQPGDESIERKGRDRVEPA